MMIYNYKLFLGLRNDKESKGVKDFMEPGSIFDKEGSVVNFAGRKLRCFYMEEANMGYCFSCDHCITQEELAKLSVGYPDTEISLCFCQKSVVFSLSDAGLFGVWRAMNGKVVFYIEISYAEYLRDMSYIALNSDRDDLYWDDNPLPILIKYLVRKTETNLFGIKKKKKSKKRR
jgi:hypothetical protein